MKNNQSKGKDVPQSKYLNALSNMIKSGKTKQISLLYTEYQTMPFFDKYKVLSNQIHQLIREKQNSITNIQQILRSKERKFISLLGECNKDISLRQVQQKIKGLFSTKEHCESIAYSIWEMAAKDKNLTLTSQKDAEKSKQTESVSTNYTVMGEVKQDKAIIQHYENIISQLVNFPKQEKIFLNKQSLIEDNCKKMLELRQTIRQIDQKVSKFKFSLGNNSPLKIRSTSFTQIPIKQNNQPANLSNWEYLLTKPFQYLLQQKEQKDKIEYQYDLIKRVINDLVTYKFDLFESNIIKFDTVIKQDLRKCKTLLQQSPNTLKRIYTRFQNILGNFKGIKVTEMQPSTQNKNNNKSAQKDYSKKFTELQQLFKNVLSLFNSFLGRIQHMEFIRPKMINYFKNQKYNLKGELELVSQEFFSLESKYNEMANLSSINQYKNISSPKKFETNNQIQQNKNKEFKQKINSLSISLKQKCDQLEKEQTETSKLKETTDQLTQEKKETEKEILQLKSDLTQIKNTLNIKSNQAKQNQLQKNQLKTKINQLQNNIGDLNKQISLNKSQIANLQQSKNLIQKDKTSYEKNNEIQKLKIENNKCRQSIKVLRQTCQQYQTQLLDKTTNLSIAQQENFKFKEDSKLKKSQIQGLKQIIQIKNKQIQTLLKQSTTLNENMKTIIQQQQKKQLIYITAQKNQINAQSNLLNKLQRIEEYQQEYVPMRKQLLDQKELIVHQNNLLLKYQNQMQSMRQLISTVRNLYKVFRHSTINTFHSIQGIICDAKLAIEEHIEFQNIRELSDFFKNIPKIVKNYKDKLEQNYNSSQRQINEQLRQAYPYPQNFNASNIDILKDCGISKIRQPDNSAEIMLQSLDDTLMNNLNPSAAIITNLHSQLEGQKMEALPEKEKGIIQLKDGKKVEKGNKLLIKQLEQGRN